MKVAAGSALAGGERTCVMGQIYLGENLIDVGIHRFIARGLQIPHGRLNIAVPKPLLHSAQIHANPQAMRRKCRAKLMTPKVSLSSSERSAHAFKQSRKSSFRARSLLSPRSLSLA